MSLFYCIWGVPVSPLSPLRGNPQQRTKTYPAAIQPSHQCPTTHTNATCFLFAGRILKVGVVLLRSLDYLPHPLGAPSHAIRLRYSCEDPLSFAGFFLPNRGLLIHGLQCKNGITKSFGIMTRCYITLRKVSRESRERESLALHIHIHRHTHMSEQKS